MEPKTQVEIQLGHMCNNRCVFCVSGQETAFGRARPLPVGPVLDRLTEAYGSGHRKVTLLGGEPTLQPGFLEVVRHAVALGFEEIVLFTNGVKTTRRAFLEQVLATGGNFTWRFSIQGATKESHERTTRRPGSFDRIIRSMEQLSELGARLTVNMCVVQSNYESVPAFPELLGRFGVTQLHLDMVRPADAGQRSEDEFRAMLPRYADLAAPLTRMVTGFPRGFDVNVGNLPYCVAPELAPWIHHDGEATDTIAVDGDGDLSRPWNKYFVKRRDKHKPEGCRACVFDARCNGIFEKYREIHGHEEFVPVTPERLLRTDPERRLLAVHLAPTLAALRAWQPPSPFERVSTRELGDREARVTMLAGAPRDALEVSFGPAGPGAASFDAFGIHIVALPQDMALARLGLRALWEQLTQMGHPIRHPLGEDAIAGSIATPLSTRLARLRRAAPFADCHWTDLVVKEQGRRVELGLVDTNGSRATFFIAEGPRGVHAGYDLGADQPSEGLVAGVAAIMHALAPRQTTAKSLGT